MLECADKRGSHHEDGPLTVCGRLRLGTGGRRSVDDVLVAAGDVGPVGRGVERGHGEGWGLAELCGEVFGEGKVGRCEDGKVEQKRAGVVVVVLSLYAQCV